MFIILLIIINNSPNFTFLAINSFLYIIKNETTVTVITLIFFIDTHFLVILIIQNT